LRWYTYTLFRERPEYVETMKSIIRVNGLAVTDKAYLRDGPVTLMVGVKNSSMVLEAEKNIEELRVSGEFDRIIRSMNLDLVQ